MSRRRRNIRSAEAATVNVDSLAHDGRGVGRINGKTVFIDGALPGETVTFRYWQSHRNYDEGIAEEILTPSANRVTPRCAHFRECGGCSLQHLAAEQQIHHKQQILLDNLRHIGNVQPQTILPPLTGPHWGYRRKARLGVKYVLKKQKMMIGFREKRSALLTDVEQCHVLHPAIGQKLPQLKELLTSLDVYLHVPQIEIAVSDESTALIFRHLLPLSPADTDKLKNFGATHAYRIYTQSGGPNTVTLLWAGTPQDLSYRLVDFNIELFFQPNDFTQVNSDINRRMVPYAIELLAPTASETVLDLFCGLGNFTLPLARRAQSVTGVEGDERLVQQAKHNAAYNQLTNVNFFAANLFEQRLTAGWAQQRFDKILLDPPRAGASEIVKEIAQFGASKLVYVSCNPATLARDASDLGKQGYQLMQAGVMDMFPHTAHVEAIAVFERT